MSRRTQVPLSVLDLAWREHGADNRDAVRGAVELARVAERLGYRRHWFAAHHGLPASAASQPPILMAAAAAATSDIRVGAGPLLLSLYSPYAVAEQFGTLRALFGDRIDLGIGRSSGGFPQTLVRGGSARPDDFPRDVVELLGHFGGDGVRRDRGPLAVPGFGDAPEVWMLGSPSGVSAQIAGSLGLPFAYAHHFAPEGTERVLDLYRRAFRPSPSLSQPYTMVSVMTVGADSSSELERQMRVTDMTHLRLLRGQVTDPIPLEESAAHVYTPQEQEALARYHHRQAVGTPDVVEASLRSLVASTGADEVMVQAVASTASGRQRSLEIAADALAVS